MRPPFPPVLHMHAVLMSTDLLFLAVADLADGNRPGAVFSAESDRSAGCS